MSIFGGGGSKVKPSYTGLATQTSTSTLPVCLLWGKNRIAPNIFWQDDFKAHKQKQKAGKGLGGSVTSYTYSGSFLLGLCEGGYDGIHGVTRVWKDQSKETSYAALGMSLFYGTNPQSPWGYLTSKHPTAALSYPGTAYLAVANYDLGNSNSLMQHSFEVEGLLWNTGVGGTVVDADPALLIDDFLTNELYGAFFPAAYIDNDWLMSGPNATTTGDSSFQTYCRAMGFALSPAMQEQEDAATALDRWTKLCNTDICWTGSTLKLIPRGDETVTANGVTYLPPNTIRYTITDSDLVRADNQDPITIARKDPQDAYNSLSMIINNRDNEYNELPVPWKDQGLIDQFGLKEESNYSAKEVCDPDMASTMVALMGQRNAYIRNDYNFSLSQEYCLLEPGDLVAFDVPGWPYFVVRLKDVEEGDNDELQIIAEEYPAGAGSGTSYSIQPVTNNPINTATPAGPINPPIIFEPPIVLSQGIPQVWAAISGGDGTTADDNWGGCYVYVSTDGVEYEVIGEIDSPARQGKLTASLATFAGTNPQSATLKVTTAMSAAELYDATSGADAAAGSTLCYVDGELLAFVTATLTGTFAYDLVTLYRGLFGSTISAHASGTNFARLDESIFSYQLPAAYIGQTLHFKFQSFNIFGGGLQDLAACTDYTYVPTGLGFSQQPAGSIYVTAKPDPVTGLSASNGYQSNTLSWTAPAAGGKPAQYKIYAINAATGSFGSAVLVGTSTTTSFAHTGLGVNDTWRYWVVASNYLGDSTEAGPINSTTNATTQGPFGFSYSGKIAGITVSTEVVGFDPGLAWNMPISLTNSQGNVTGAPTAQTDFDIRVAGVSVGTMRFASGSTTATFIKAAASSIALGVRTSVVAPANLNGMTGMLDFTILGSK